MTLISAAVAPAFANIANPAAAAHNVCLDRSVIQLLIMFLLLARTPSGSGDQGFTVKICLLSRTCRRWSSAGLTRVGIARLNANSVNSRNPCPVDRATGPLAPHLGLFVTSLISQQ